MDTPHFTELTTRARNFFSCGKYTEAEKSYRLAPLLDGENLYLFANTLVINKKYSEAKEVLEELLSPLFCIQVLHLLSLVHEKLNPGCKEAAEFQKKYNNKLNTAS